MYGFNLKTPSYVPTYHASFDWTLEPHSLTSHKTPIEKLVAKLLIRSDAAWSSIADERKNFGIVVRAIIHSGEARYGKWVTGEVYKTTMSENAEALDRLVQEQFGHEI